MSERLMDAGLGTAAGMTTAGATAAPGDVAGPVNPVTARRSLQASIVRGVLLVLFALFFIVPFLGMVEVSTRKGADISDGRTLEYYKQIFQTPELVGAIRDSLILAVITTLVTLVLLLPTMVWVKLRVPRLARVVELICLLPLTIPAIVLVVGWAPIYLWINYFTPVQYETSPLVLAFAYVILVLPYAYRTLDTGLTAIDIRTLSEAARSLGASWSTVMLRVITPNMTAAVLNSALLAVSIVLGEFTVASLLNYVNLQVEMQLISQQNAGVSVAVAVTALLAIFILLFLLTLVGRRQRSSRR